MNQYQLLQGDCREVLKTLPDNSVDAIVTDPPYGLEFMGKDWDAPWKSKDVRQPNDEGFTKTDNAYGRSKVRYAMGSSYGGGNEAMIGFQEWFTEVAVEAYRVLKPGGHILSFGGSRTYHRMACAIEDAGFEVRDQMMWVYGSGFPKSHNIGNDIDKRMGHPPRGRAIPVASTHLPSGKYAEDGGEKLEGNKVEPFVAKSEEAKPWQGWGTALKPAHEPICVARKPLDGTVANNVLKWGVGGLNIDGCRVETNPAVDDPRLGGNGTWKSDKMAANVYGKYEGKIVGSFAKGRFPANLIHDGSQQVLDLFPESNGGAAPKKANTIKTLFQGGWNGIEREERIDFGSGSAARFFYCPKASKSDRDEGCEELPTQEKPAHMRTADGTGETSMTDGFQPTQRKNTHPTVKPTELMRYLVRLVTPPNGLVLDPFNGSGSTGKACMLEGFRYIGIEMNPDYIKIAEARISNALKQ